MEPTSFFSLLLGGEEKKKEKQFSLARRRRIWYFPRIYTILYSILTFNFIRFNKKNGLNIKNINYVREKIPPFPAVYGFLPKSGYFFLDLATVINLGPSLRKLRTCITSLTNFSCFYCKTQSVLLDFSILPRYSLLRRRNSFFLSIQPP